MSDTESTLSAPDTSTMASCAARASNLFGAVRKGMPVSEARALATWCGGTGEQRIRVARFY